VGKRSPQYIDVQVGKNIKNARLQKGWSQETLGQRIDMSYQQINRYETGQSRVGASRLTRIAEALQVPIHSLFGSGERMPGKISAEPAAMRLVNADSLRLLQAFHKIKLRQMRLATLRLFEAIGRSYRSEHANPKKRSRTRRRAQPGRAVR
jgi:transcriptional regulator with XRE-family HTH domain